MISEPAGCSVSACGRPPEWQPVLLLRARFSAPVTHVELSLGFCARCRDGLQASAVLSDAGWARLAAWCVLLGHEAPARELTGLRWEPLA